MGQVVHFEITADDIARAKKFYEIFGWKTEDAMMPGIEYWLVKTGSDDVTKNGAIMSRQYSKQPVINWISVDDLDKMVEEVKKAGGKIVNQKQTIPGVGDTIYATDTEGNQFGMLQPAPRAN